MQDQEQIIELAKLSGAFSDNHANNIIMAWQDSPVFEQKLKENGLDFLTSRDAIVPVIEKQPKYIQEKVIARIHWLWSKGQEETDFSFALMVLLLTPRQLCEALLRATGKWKE